ncbi:MAG: SDR family NAD(P)-dependent oxidoreductase [Parachlamydiaceae bacterium]|nr:SDR family NAD(P)-dependent oxidoreductase [Parachlamydiaceae bacterium]
MNSIEKICIITGATSGIGKYTALRLAKEGWVVGIICRSEKSGKLTLQTILSACPTAKIDLFVCDLSSQSAIRSLSTSLCQKYKKIDALVHNAGLISPIRQLTVDGIELTFAVNHLAPFLLTSLLMPVLKAAPESKIVLVTSRAEELGRINFNDLQGEKKYNWARSYTQSKLANLLFAYELCEREKKNRVSVLALHPGLTQSKLGRNLNGICKYLPLVLNPFMQKPEKAATFLIDLLNLPYFSEPGYFIKNKIARSSQYSYDKDLRSKLWAISETLTQGTK